MCLLRWKQTKQPWTGRTRQVPHRHLTEVPIELHQGSKAAKVACCLAHYMSHAAALLQDDGFVAKILVPEGEKDIPVGTPLVVLVDDESAVEKFKDYTQSAAGATAKPDAAPKQEDSDPTSAGPGTSHSTRVTAFPITERCAKSSQRSQS